MPQNHSRKKNAHAAEMTLGAKEALEAIQHAWQAETLTANTEAFCCKP